MKTIEKNKLYTITEQWITNDSQVDKSTWTYDPNSKAYINNHGSRMIPDSKTGRFNILMGIDARNNKGTIRTGEAMIRFMTTLAAQCGFEKPGKQAKQYGNNWLNEGLIQEYVNKPFDSIVDTITTYCNILKDFDPSLGRIERDAIYQHMKKTYGDKAIGYGMAITKEVMQEVAERLGGEYILIKGTPRSYILLPVESAAA
jgi:hypothetical protein